ncbi:MULTISPECIES: tripartite tricarboxylate transporter substrate binding protein [Halomonas]|uniref:Tricarboxylate transport protein TctC n=1 Tax=Halomonas citrativorans TaxID=2742612 RepID=A0A1R4I025_9GAMM|nr:tripartite tricarboxylate transporter substrate binding protein [Halomonas citrativorans]SJN13066.1 Tricarboxylate transport protein TctC [Halomonas citrativorans]
MHLKTSRSLLILCTTSLVSSLALADYPERPIEMIVAYSAGGGTDVAARTLVPYLEKHLNADITVVNRPGAGGEVGFTALANAKPDGYTIGFINTPNVISIPIERDTRYEFSDFSLVANIIDDPAGFSVHPDSSFQTFEELVEYAKAHPGELTYGTSGVGGDDHLATLALERQADIEMNHVPFPGAADVRQALMGGHIDIGVINVSEIASAAKAGQVRTLAQGGEERWEEAPDVPTFKELGYDLVMGSARGIAAPAGVPDEIINKISEAAKAAIEEEEFQAAADQQSLPLSYLAPEDYRAMLEEQQERFQALWNESPWNE